jgi:hypothetical protein
MAFNNFSHASRVARHRLATVTRSAEDQVITVITIAFSVTLPRAGHFRSRAGLSDAAQATVGRHQESAAYRYCVTCSGIPFATALMSYG